MPDFLFEFFCRYSLEIQMQALNLKIASRSLLLFWDPGWKDAHGLFVLTLFWIFQGKKAFKVLLNLVRSFLRLRKESFSKSKIQCNLRH
jgi:hypothetical protein